MPTVVHFEIPTDDIERGKKFYTELFGWNIEKSDLEDGMEYWMISTTDKDGKDAICGGMLPRQNEHHPITNYIDVPSVEEYTSKIADLGGQVLVEKTPVPGMGYFAVFLDTEKNVFGIWEDNLEAKTCCGGGSCSS